MHRPSFADPRTRDLEIVIVAYNCADLLRNCLRSLPGACGRLSWRCTVVDNASSDGSADVAAAASIPVEIIRNATNPGFARANNQALRAAHARYLLLLNPDTEAHPDSLFTLVSFMDAHPGAGACGPMLLNSDGSIQPNGRRFPTLLRELLSATGAAQLLPRLSRSLEYGRERMDVETPVDYVMGACLLARAQTLREVGLLDESYFMFYEEVEWCRRMKRAGWEIWYVPEAKVVHHWMGSVRLAPRRMSRIFYQSQVRYFRRTAGTWSGVAAALIAALGLFRIEMLHFGAAVKRSLRRALRLRSP